MATYILGGDPFQTANASFQGSLSAAGDAVTTKKNALTRVQDYEPAVKEAQTNMNAQAKKVADQAPMINKSADSVRDVANQMKPLAGEVQKVGETMVGEGTAMYNTGVDISKYGLGMLGMDPSVGGVAAEWINQYGQYDPNMFASFAAQDARSQFENSFSQSERDLQRRGVNSSSGAAGALQRQKTQLMATAVAAAVTKARQAGLEAKTGFLKTFTDEARSLLGTGESYMTNGAAVQNNGAGNIGKAADILDKVAGNYVNEGKLREEAAGVLSTSATIFGNAAKLGLDYTKQLTDAYGELASAEQFYSTASLNVGRQAAALWDAYNAQQNAETYDPWEETGHNSTYWQNKLSGSAYANDAYQNMAMAMSAQKANVIAKTGGKVR